ncbi:alpha/beta hydrolase [Halomonas sp. V046]|uniref:alpha/beta hydrolase n=1 Tax=Halomonas sp. V046 TaxID=3459611 RepID=UPI00404439CD
MTDFTPLQALDGLTRVDANALAPTSTLAKYLTHYGLRAMLTNAITLHAGNLATPRFRLWTQVWSPPRPRATAIIVHGYYDHLGLYRHLLKLLLEENLRVVLWDLPGHGLSSGERADIADFADYGDSLSMLQDHLTREGLAEGPWIGVGQSTGAAILATDALTRGADHHWTALVLLAPLVRPWGWARSSWVHRLVSPFVASVPRRFRANSNDADFAAFLRENDPLQPVRLPTGWVTAMRRWMPRLMDLPPCPLPTLILQGDKDLTVDGPWNLAVLEKKFPNACIHRHPEARHHLVNEAETIRAELFGHLHDFLAGRLRPTSKTRTSCRCPDA